MKNNISKIAIGCCSVFFCAASYFGSNNTEPSGSAIDIGKSSGSPDIGNINNNYWGGGNPFPNPPGNTTIIQSGIAYSGDSAHTLISEDSAYDECGGFTPASTKPKGMQPQVVNQISTYDTCGYLKLWSNQKPQPGDYQLAKEQNDSLRFYIEKCAASDNTSWQVFSSLDGAVQLMSNDTTRFDSYRGWLISVLYLNKTNPAYFCRVLGSIDGTYPYGKYNPLGALAIDNWVRHNHPECWGAADDQQYAQDSLLDYQNGFDPTHLPSLDSMGLGFLLHGMGGVAPTLQLSQQFLASFTTNPNPFHAETTLEFTLNRMAYITFSVYDDLGRLVFGDGRGSSLEAGVHTIHLDGSKLPSGTFYARIATGFGEVQTLKLVHEK